MTFEKRPKRKSGRPATTSQIILLQSVRKAVTATSPNCDRRGALHPRHRHDLDNFYPCARHLQMGMVLAEYLRGCVM